jgi:hypothetical protein
MPKSWFVIRNEQRLGPFSSGQLKKLADAGKLKHHDQVLQEGLAQPVRAESIKGLFGAAATAPSTESPPPITSVGELKTSPPPLSTAPGAQVASRKLLFGGVAIAVAAMIGIGWAISGGEENGSSGDGGGTSVAESSGAAPAESTDPTADAVDTAASLASNEGSESPLEEMPQAQPDADAATDVAATEQETVEATEPTVMEEPAVIEEPAGQLSEQGNSDLDQLLILLSQPVFVGDAVPSIQSDEAWIGEMTALLSSNEAAIVQATAAAARVVEARDNAQVLKQGVEAFKEKMQGEAGPHVGRMWSSLWDTWLSDSALEDLVREGRLERSQMEDYKRTRDASQKADEEAWMGFVGPLFKAGVRENVTEPLIRRLRKRSEVVASKIVAEQLRPLLLARAGATAESSGLDVKIGMSPDRKFETRGLATVTSQADQELTRVTVLLELVSPVGSRFVAAFVPSLPMGGSFRIAPFAYHYWDVDHPELDPPPTGLTSRISVYCDQFSCENQEIGPVGAAEARMAYALEAFRPGHAYVADPYPRHKDKRRYEFVFTELEEQGENQRIAGEFNVYEPEDHENPAEHSALTGTLTPAPIVRDPGFNLTGAPQQGALVAHLKAGGHAIDLRVLVADDGTLEWAAQDGPLADREVVARAEAKQTDERRADFQAHHAKIKEGIALAMNGDREAAEQFFNDYISSQPGAKFEDDAREQIRMLDRYVDQGAKLKEYREQSQQRREANKMRKPPNMRLKGRQPE